MREFNISSVHDYDIFGILMLEIPYLLIMPQRVNSVNKPYVHCFMHI